MAGIIIFIILAVGYALCGDTSGIEAIGKIVGVGVLIFGALWVIAYCPWMIIVIIAILILIVVLSNSSNHNNTNYDNKNIYYKENNNNDSIIKSNSNINTTLNTNQSITDFQRQLQENTKTPRQVEDENWLKEKDYIIQVAERDYNNIKNKLLEKAKNAEYTFANHHKQIIYKYDCSFLLSCIHREHYYNPTGKLGTSSYRTNKKVTYTINKIKQYDFYLSTIKELSSNDNISITPFFVELDPVVYQKENSITLPYTYKHEWHTNSHKIKAYLKCSIQY